MSETIESQLKKRIDELNTKNSIYDDIMAYVQKRIDNSFEGSVGKQTYTNILSQLKSQKAQIVRSLEWRQKELQKLKNQQSPTSQ